MITPLSPRWKASIEQRLEQMRQMTSVAVLNGARLASSQYWNIPGAFLFTIYVITALGFGAPVPQTVEGRISTFIYAILAVPSHFYLMLNASTAIAVQTEVFMEQSRTSLRNKILITGKPQLDNEGPDCSRNSAYMNSPRRYLLGKCIMCLLDMLAVFHCVPLAAMLYYAMGACIFGALREHDILKIAMFPLEFTTSGGLDRVSGGFRIMYGFYVEGAVILIACALATLRRHSSPIIEQMKRQYRLFTNDNTIL